MPPAARETVALGVRRLAAYQDEAYARLYLQRLATVRKADERAKADGRLLRVDTFQKLDRYKEHDIEVVVADLKGKSPKEPGAALALALKLGKGACFLLTPANEILSWFSTTRTDIETGESFPELDPKNFSFNSPRGWCPTCRGHGRVFPWMLQLDKTEEGEEADVTLRLRAFGVE